VALNTSGRVDANRSGCHKSAKTTAAPANPSLRQLYSRRFLPGKRRWRPQIKNPHARKGRKGRKGPSAASGPQPKVAQASRLHPRTAGETPALRGSGEESAKVFKYLREKLHKRQKSLAADSTLILLQIAPFSGMMGAPIGSSLGRHIALRGSQNG
jgi:hypothetical protein